MRAYKSLETAGVLDVAAACDIDEAKLQNYASQYRIPATYTDYNEMMAKEELDCVSVCTWYAAHKGAVIVALNGGANVLCEEPMAMNAAEAVEMMNCAKENGKLLQMGFVRLFENDAITIKCFAESGNIGDVYYEK